MGKNDKQLIKALQKINLINTLIELFEKCNELEDYNNMKSYLVTLDYLDKKDYTKFFIKLNKTKSEKNDTIFDMNFSLNNKQKGLELFQKLREKFVERDSIQYSGFLINDDVQKKHFIKKNNNVELKTNIHNNDEYKLLEDYNKKIAESNVFGYKGFNVSGKTKDQLQLIKAKAKANIVCSIINSLSYLNNLEDNYNDMKPYKLDIKYSIHNDNIYDEKYYKYSINLIKNGLEKDKILLYLNFSLKNHEIGLKIIEKIIRNFTQNTDILFTLMNNNNLTVLNKSNIQIINNFKTEKEKQIFNMLNEELAPNIISNNHNSKVKKLEM